jgi:hypothetical protein
MRLLYSERETRPEGGTCAFRTLDSTPRTRGRAHGIRTTGARAGQRPCSIRRPRSSSQAASPDVAHTRCSGLVEAHSVHGGRGRMTAHILWPPGTALGECAPACPTPRPHLICSIKRAIAEHPCSLCGQKIGYDAPFLIDNPVVYLTHLECQCRADAAGSGGP